MHERSYSRNTTTKSLVWEKSPQLIQLVGFFDPKMVFFRLRKSQKSKEKHMCFQFGGRASADYLR